MKKIAFRLNSDKAVEYANAHRETNYGDYGRLSGDWETWFHIPAFKSFDGLRHQNHYLDFPAPGYTDVTENFERDYYWPWKEGKGIASETEMMEAGLSELFEWQKSVDEKNKILLDAIRLVKGENFYDDLLEEIKESEGIQGLAEIVDTPKGKRSQDHNEMEVWVNQTTNGGHTGDSYAGDVYVRISRGRYFKFAYSM